MEELKKIYSELKAIHGDKVESCAWTNVEKCIQRYSQGMKLIDKGSILEVGCGNGFLLSNFEFKTKLNYLGIDILQDFVVDCKNKFVDQKFEVFDILQNPYPKKYDNVFSIGVFNMKFGEIEMYDYITKAILNCVASANKTVILNGFHTNVDYQEDHIFYYDLDVLGKILNSKCIKHEFIVGKGMLKHEFYLLIQL